MAEQRNSFFQVLLDDVRVVARDPEVRQMAKSAGRLLVNGSVILSDFIPGFVPGETASWAADGLKTWSRIPFIPRRLKVDFTPGVSLKASIGTEVLEFATGGFAPTHAIETAIWLKNFGGPEIIRDAIRVGKVINEQRRGRREVENID